MTQSRVIGIANVLLAVALSVPAWGADSARQGADSAHPESAKANPARPGSLNYVEGQAAIEGQSLGPEAIGKTELKPGQSLETQTGKAEVLLTPGVFFRLGDASSVTMISPTLTDTELRLDKGEATVEVAELHPENNVVIAEDDAKVRLTKTGFYDFDADHDIVRVYQGEADVEVNGQDIKVENEHQLAFNVGAPMKPEKFDKEQVQDDLYRWSSLRSSYLAEANVDRAQDYQVGSYGAGWDWDPYYGAYTFIPGNGTFYSPFGWGFYSPFDVGFAPFFFFGHFDRDFDRDFRHFHDRDHDRDHFADRGHGDREHGGDGEHHEAHYYDHFDHGSYHGPGHSDHSGFNGGGVVAAGSHVEFHGGKGFRGGHSGEGVHGGGAGHVGGGALGGGGFHGGGGGGGHAGGGGGGHH
jgi:FecR protein